MPVRPPPYGEYRWSNVRRTGRILRFRCGLCRTQTFFDPNDLIVLYGDQDWQDVPFDCSRCSKREYVDVTMYRPEPGDYGHLLIRKPGKVKQVQTWQTLRLGDEFR